MPEYCERSLWLLTREVANDAHGEQAEDVSAITASSILLRRQRTVPEYCERSLWLLTREVANDAHGEQAEDVSAISTLHAPF